MTPARPPRTGLKPAANKSPVATNPAPKTSQLFSPTRSPAAPTAQAPSNLSRTPSVSVRPGNPTTPVKVGRARPGRRVVQRSSPVACVVGGSLLAENTSTILTAALTGGGTQQVLSLLPWIVTGVLVLSILLEKARVLFFTHAVAAPRRRSPVRSCRKKAPRSTRPVALLTLIAFLLLTLPFSQSVSAAVTTVPQKHVYSGHLLDPSGKPITFPVTIRFSYWKSADAVPTDLSEGAINTGAPNYMSWQEVQTVMPDGKGFFSVRLGSVTPLPDLSAMPAGMLLSLHLQVEVKPAPAPLSAYELLDTDPDAAQDRAPILSVPFALNADKLDQRDTGNGSGSIMVLGSGGLVPVRAIPGATNRDSFILDADNSAVSTIALTFGTTLSKALSYDIPTDRFSFNANVRVLGNLNVTGTINGVAVRGMVPEVLHPAYEGASYKADGTDNVGQLSVTTDNTTLRNEYVWTSSRGTLQDYDILVRASLPADFQQWRDGITLAYRTSSPGVSDNKAEIQVYDTTAAAVTLSGAVTNLTSLSWTTTHVEFGGSPVWTAGSEFMIRIRVFARNNARMEIGDLKLDYTNSSPQ